MSKEKTVKLTEKEAEILRECLSDKKQYERIKIGGDKTKGNNQREAAIEKIYDIERIEKKLN